MYKEKRLPRSEFVPIRGLDYHVQIWEDPNRPASSLPPLLLLHGWMDVAASYQFMVDALSDAFAAGRTIIAPDWRGFGLTASKESGKEISVGDTAVAPGRSQARPAPAGSAGATDTYWFPDYLADLDFLLDHYVHETAIDLVGHSMGGNVAMTYAGVRPERIRKLVNLEGFGMPASRPSQAAGRYAKWMDELKSLQRGEMDLKAYEGREGVARRLMKTNPRLSADKAHWLAGHWARPDADGKWLILGDPAHKITSAMLYRADETMEIYKRISAPTLAVEASDDSLAKWHQGNYTLAEYHERLKLVENARVAVIQDAGHMLHHDQPAQLAALIEDFLI